MIVHECRGLSLAEAFEAFLALKKIEQGVSRLPVYIDFFQLGETGFVINLAELVNLLIAPRSLAAELITGEVQYFQTFIIIRFVELFKGFILGGETAASGCVHNEKDFASVRIQGELLSISLFCRIIVYTHLCLLSFIG